MIDVTPECFVDIVGEENAIKIMRALKGCRIYIPKCRTIHDEIKQDYKSLTSDHRKKIKILSEAYEISEQQIRKILRDQKGLFDEH